MLTRSGVLVAVGALGSFIVGRLLGVTELYVLGAAAMALVVLALAWVRRRPPALSVARHLRPARTSVGTLARVDVELENRGSRTSPVVTVIDEVAGTVGAHLIAAPVPAGSTLHLGYRLPTAQRGLLRVGPLRLELTDPFGLARRIVPGVGEAVLTVLPAIDPLDTGPIGGGRHEPLNGLSTRSMAARGIEDLATLRPYVVGDDLRRVHWPSSARVDGLVVRRDEEHWQGHLTVVLDTRPDAMDPACFERAVSAAASLVHAVGEAADRIRLLYTGGFDSGMIDARRSAGTLLQGLAVVAQTNESDHVGSSVEHRERAAIVLTGGDGDTAPLRLGGYTSIQLVRFISSGHLGNGTDPHDGSLLVSPDQPFAAAWNGTVRHHAPAHRS